MKRAIFGTTLFFSAALVACGGPDIEKVKADFESPSGSTKDQSGVIAASSKRDGSSGVMALGAGGVPGQSLTAARPRRGFDQANLGRTWGKRAESLRDLLVTRKVPAQQQQNLGPSACDNSPEARAAYEEMISGFVGDALGTALNPFSDTISGSASYTQDFSTCSNGELTGSADIELEYEFSENRFRFAVTYNLDNVCETAGDQACISGEMIAEALIEGDDLMGQLSFTTAWQVDGSWNDDGTRREATLSGGVRIKLEGNQDGSGSATLQYLVYVNTPDGDEYSYVWEVVAQGDGQGNGSVTWRCRGSDGSIDCHADENGGMCTATDASGTVVVSWTRDQEAGLDEEWFE